MTEGAIICITGDNLEAIGVVITVLAVVGAVLNNRRRRSCFWLWLVSNAPSLGVHVAVGLWALAARDAIFFILAIEGLRRWKRA